MGSDALLLTVASTILLLKGVRSVTSRVVAECDVDSDRCDWWMRPATGERANWNTTSAIFNNTIYTEPVTDSRGKDGEFFLMITDGSPTGVASMSVKVNRGGNADRQVYCIQFDYWMYGFISDGPSLAVWLTESKAVHKVWHDEANRGRYWSSTESEFVVTTKEFNVTIDGKRGNSADVAIDNIRLVEGKCQGPKEDSRRASLGEESTTEYNHISYSVPLNLTTSNAGCRHICRRKNLNLAKLSHARGLKKSQDNYGDNCFDRIPKCSEDAPDGGCSGARGKDLPWYYIPYNCSVACQYCDENVYNETSVLDDRMTCHKTSYEGSCERFIHWNMVRCGRTCKVMRYKGPSNHIFLTPFWVREDGTGSDLKTIKWNNIDPDWTGNCPAYTVKHGFVYMPCNALLPCMCEDFKAPVYTDVVAQMAILETNSTGPFNRSAGCEHMDGRKEAKVINLDLKNQHHVTSVMVSVQNDHPTPPGYYEPLEELPSSPLAKDPYFNMAVGRPSYLSSVVQDEWGGTASVANDGRRNHSHDLNYTVCTWTATGVTKGVHWWYVDLQSNYEVHAVTVTRRDCCREDDFGDFKIVVDNSSLTGNDMNIYYEEAKGLCHNHSGEAQPMATPTRTYHCEQPTTGRYVVIMKSQLDWEAISLTVCELEVHGQPVDVPEEKVPRLQYCPDEFAHLLNGYCYRFFGRPGPYDQQVVTCRQWDPPYSEMVPVADLDPVEADALRQLLYIVYGETWVWTTSYGPKCNKMSVLRSNFKMIATPPEGCVSNYAVICRSLAQEVYPTPMIGLPTPDPTSGPAVDGIYDRVIFPESNIPEDSLLLQWELYFSYNMTSEAEVHLLVLEEVNGQVKVRTRFRLQPFIHIGVNFGGHYIDRSDFLSLPKGTFIGLEGVGTNLTDIIDIPKTVGTRGTSTVVEFYEEGRKDLTARTNFPFRIWTLPKTVGFIRRRCYLDPDIQPNYKGGGLGEYLQPYMRTARYGDRPKTCKERCQLDDLCYWFYPNVKYCLLSAAEQVVTGVYMYTGGFTKVCQPYERHLIHPVDPTTQAAVSVRAGSTSCDRVTSYVDGRSAILYYCNATTSAIQVRVEKGQAKICQVHAYGERVTDKASTTMIPQDASRVRGNIRPFSNVNCAPIGLSRTAVHWIQVDLLVTYYGVTAKALFRESKLAKAPKFHLYVTSVPNWADSDPYYVGQVDRVDRQIKFPCSPCHSGRFVTMVEVGNALGMEICRFDTFGDRGLERRLGLAGGLILDPSVTASDHLNGTEPHKARLDFDGAWCAAPYTFYNKPYLQVVLPNVSVITAIETQGRDKPETKERDSIGVTAYLIKYGMDEHHMVRYRDEFKMRKIFFTETLGVASTVHRLTLPIQCKVIQIHVESYNTEPCLRLELLGYPVTAKVNPDYKVTSPMTIYSPGAPNYYGNDRIITWTITPPDGKYIRLVNVTLKVEANEAAKIKMEEWTNQPGTICQDYYTLYYINSTSIITNFGYYVHGLSEPLKLKLHSCLFTALRSKGYLEAHLDFVDCPGYTFHHKTCDKPFGPFTTACGYVGSPMFPDPYPATKTCTWLIRSAPAQYVNLEFVHFDVTGDGATCTGDKLSFSYMDNNIKVPLRDVCNGNWKPGPVQSDWNTLIVDYNRVRTAAAAGKGFIAKFSVMDPIKEQDFNYTEGSCDDGWQRFMSGCYKFFAMNTTLTWTEAEYNCQSLATDSHLTSVQDDYQRDFILHSLFYRWAFTPDLPIYIGLNDRTSNGRFEWTDGTPVAYTTWDNGQPDGSLLEACGMMRVDSLISGRYWNDIPCAREMTRQYICKTPARNVTLFPVSDIEGVITAWNETCDPKRQFHCNNGDCIQNLFVCDGNRDCRDGSDEVTCPKVTDACPVNSFRCQNGDCISISKYCDHVDDCTTGEDETGCVWAPCRLGEFRCDNGQCVRKATPIHDLIKDCVDGSDENQKGCPGFQCYSGDCIPKSLQCDGIKDCMGTYNEDETGCDQVTKHAGQGLRNCTTGPKYDSRYRCIYDKDHFNYPLGCRDLSHLQGCAEFTCPQDHLKCPGHYCLPVRMMCDGKNDCPNNEDEMNCDSYTCPGLFKCRNANNCIPQASVCDGTKQCPHGDDELGCSSCPTECECVGHSYQCPKRQLRNFPAVPRDAREVNMSGNYLNTLPRLDFPFLGILDLSRNNISTIEAGVFTLLINLYHLDLRFNNLRSLSGQAFVGLARLQTLMITGNPRIEAIEPNAFVISQDGKGLPVPHMNLSSCSIKELGKTALKGLAETLVLDLANNGIRIIATETFTETKKVQYLNISGNDIKDFNGKEAFVALPDLRHLKSDHFRFCCQAPQVPEEDCFPQKDAFSSCTDLIRLDVLRIFLWLLGTVALLGNILVLLLRLVAKEPMTANTSIITSLAMSDFLMGVYLYIIAVADMVFRGFYIEVDESWRTGPGCSIAGFLAVLSSEVSVFSLTIMSVDRFLVVVFPFSKHKINLKKAKTLIIISWIAGILIAGIPLIPNDYFGGKFYSRSGVCLSLHLTSDTTPGWEYSVAIFLGLNLAAFLIIMVTYTWMYIVIKQSVDMMRSKTSRKKGGNKELVIARKMALIILTDFACWMPIIILGFAAMSGKVVIPGDVYAWIAVFVLPVNSAANPVLYTLSSVETIKQMFRKKETSKAGDSITKTTMSYADDDDDDDSTVKLVNCYQDGSYLLPYVPDDPQMKTLGYIMKDGSEALSLTDHLTVLRFVSRGMLSLHDGGLTASSLVAEDIGVILNDREKMAPNRIHSAYLCSGVKQAIIEGDLRENIMAFGNLCKKILRQYTMQRKGP